jgi:hypothetical protein
MSIPSLVKGSSPRLAREQKWLVMVVSKKRDLVQIVLARSGVVSCGKTIMGIQRNERELVAELDVLPNSRLG